MSKHTDKLVDEMASIIERARNPRKPRGPAEHEREKQFTITFGKFVLGLFDDIRNDQKRVADALENIAESQERISRHG